MQYDQKLGWKISLATGKGPPLFSNKEGIRDGAGCPGLKFNASLGLPP